MLTDILDMDLSRLGRSSRFYGFDSFLQLGKGIFIYPVKSKAAKGGFTCAGPSIVFSHDTEELIRVVKRFDIIYSTTYDASPALLTRVSAARRKALVNISDILSKEGADRAQMMHRITRFLGFCASYRVEVVFASMAKDEFGIRSPQEMMDVFAQLGADREPIRYSYSVINDISWKGSE